SADASVGGPHHRACAHVYQNEWIVKCSFLILIWTIIMIQTHPEDLLRHIASRCVGAPWVGLSRAGGGCGPREPVCVSPSWVHATEVTQNSPHHRLSRSCISKRSKIVVERWQIPSFVPGRDAWECPSHSPLVDCGVLRYTWSRAVTTGPNTRVEV